MLRLRMLGGLSIEHLADQPSHVQSRASSSVPPALNGAALQRRPLALLALLAIAGEHGLSRDELLVHMWPDSTPPRARNVLKQTLYSLRRDLRAADLVLVSGDRVRINPNVLTSDVAEFEAALDRCDIERARQLYQGPFLEGFALSDVPEFERWVRSERVRLTARFDGARQPPRAKSADADTSERRDRDRTRARWARMKWRSHVSVAAIVTLTSLAAFQAAHRVQGTARTHAPVDPMLLAVLPFDVGGADSSLRFLANGMVDLLAVRLSGDRKGSVRTVSPRVAIAAWEDTLFSPEKESTLRVGQRLGAGRVLRGGVVGTPRQVVLTADMIEAPNGKTLARASVVGTADSLSVLVDRLAATLLLGADAADEPALSEALARTPFAAIRDYVEGQAAYRSGHYNEAVDRFTRAVARDSTFALAALGLAQSAGWAGASEKSIQRGATLAWRYQDRLPLRARLILQSSVGGSDALATGYAPDAAVTNAAERAVEANPDDPEAWYRLGDHYLHLGSAIGLEEPIARAAAAFRRAIGLDKSFVPPFIHLMQLAARSGDTATVRHLGRELLQRDSTSEAAHFISWRMALALGDAAALRVLRSRFDEMPLGALRLILSTAQCDAVGLVDADSALAAVLRRSATPDQRAVAFVQAHAYALDRGRWSAALHATEGLKDADPVPRWHLRIRVLDALYGGADTAAARAAIDSLAPFADAPLATDVRARSAQYDDITVVTQWRLWNGDARTLKRAVQRLTPNSAHPDALRRVVANRIAAALLQAITANSGERRDLASVVKLDELIAANVFAPHEWPGLYPAFVAAKLFALNNQPNRALTAVRRRVNYFPESTYLAPSLALEAELAEQLGDRVAAASIRRTLHALRG